MSTGFLNVLVTGSNGMLGYDIMRCKNDIEANSRYRLIPGLGHDQVDITNKDLIKKIVKENKIVGIINCAAYTNVEKAETEKKKAWDINTIGPENLAEAMRDVNGFLIHFSTDYVYGGEHNTPIDEDEECDPENYYGYSKYCGELNIQRSKLKNYYIIRTSWLYGINSKTSFPYKILEKAKDYNKDIHVVDDQIGSPTYSKDLAQAVASIMTSPKFLDNPGIYNYSNAGTCSWYDFAYTAVRFEHYKADFIKPCSSQEYKTLAKRPTYSVLNTDKIKNTFDLEISQWSDIPLRDFILELRYRQN